MNKKIVIISGGELEEEFVLSILEKEENQYVIGALRRRGLCSAGVCQGTSGGRKAGGNPYGRRNHCVRPLGASGGRAALAGPGADG